MARRVVITGMGVVTALGSALDEYWANLCAGKSGVGPLTLFDTTDFKVHFGGQVREFNPEALFGSKEARRPRRRLWPKKAASIPSFPRSASR